jgi:hypothetical protein
MKIKIAWLLPLMITGYLVSGCTPNAKYERRLKHELATGVRYDSLFMGLYLGMPQKDFYIHCWQLNKKGLIRQNHDNTQVEYHMKNELKSPAVMDFYPTFSEGNISEMPVTYRYEAWAPWNKALSSKNLQIDVLRYYKKIYGDGFMTVRHHIRGDMYLKIDGNRRISIITKDDLHVVAVFTDMLVKRDTVVPPPSGSNVNDTTKAPEKK